MALYIDRKAYIRKAHKRKSYTKEGKKISESYVDKTKVPRSRFLIKDRGGPGRAKKILPPIKNPGALGKGYFTKKSFSQQKKILSRIAREKGGQSAQGKMQWMATMNKRTNPQIAKRAAKLRQWVAKNY